ncbi:unknown [[Eubacterium] siraeum CAG:80]|jgi:hypothetical protein|uniref:Uncharacterized protein n=1 Tax=[Eubacterium] siraeum CAG:80 TaxID=1263080 RepID=R6RGP7_9FIRM|nr:unknown [[Eubacterium] siraeum CAG:80]
MSARRKKESNIQKINPIDAIVNLFVKNAVRLIVLAMAVAVVLPLFILLLYDENLPITIHTDITADGLLGYVGSMLICLSSLVLSSIAIYQNTENKKKTEKEQIESFLHLHIEQISNTNMFRLQLDNFSSNVALEIKLGQKMLFSAIRSNETAEIVFSIGKSDSSVLNFCENEMLISECSNLPLTLDLTYRDIRYNLITSCYKFTGEYYYQRL